MYNYPPLHLWEALAYNVINREKKWIVLTGFYIGKVFMFHGVKSFDGDIDVISMREINTNEIVDFIENINIIQID